MYYDLPEIMDYDFTLGLMLSIKVKNRASNALCNITATIKVIQYNLLNKNHKLKQLMDPP